MYARMLSSSWGCDGVVTDDGADGRLAVSSMLQFEVRCESPLGSGNETSGVVTMVTVGLSITIGFDSTGSSCCRFVKCLVNVMQHDVAKLIVIPFAFDQIHDAVQRWSLPLAVL